MFINLKKHECYLFLIVLICFVKLFESATEVHYNIADPDCNGPFGLCTQEDKDTLGYLAIKKLHAKMDEDSDGQVEVQETKEFMKEELQYKNGAAYSERQKKFHGNDMLISVDEMWKSWQYSPVYNWTTDNLVSWLNEHVKLPQYADNFRRNRIDGQFLPRLAINENNYYSNIMQIKDPRHRRLLMIKSTDLILFGQQHKPHNLIKDVLMITSLTMSIFVCIYLYTKHRQSVEQIKRMLIEFEKLSDIEDGTVVNQIKNNLTSNASLFSFKLRKNSIENSETTSTTQMKRKEESLLMSEKNATLTRELNVVKQEADHLRKARENTEEGQLAQLKLAEQELEKVRNALRQTEARLELVKYQPPVNLINLLNRTFESEKELLDYKFKLIDKEKETCVDSLKKVCKRQSGLLGALKIAHSSTLEDIQHKLEILTRELKKLNAEKHELHKRWSSIFDLCSRTTEIGTTSSFDKGSQDLPLISLPRKLWQIANNNNDRNENSKILTNNRINKARNASLLNDLNKSANNSDELIDEKIIETTNKNKPIVQSTSFATISSAKLLKNKYSVENFYDLEATEQNQLSKSITTTTPTNTIIFDDKNNNNHSLANLNENKTIIQQPSSQSPSFIVKVNHHHPDLNKNPILINNNTITNIVSTPTSQKIARQSLIHKNDVFQFDDVDSVRTSDLYFKSTPQSSFESSGSTCQSSLTNANNLKTKFSSSFKKKTSGFFRPLNGSAVSSSKIKKSSTSAKIVESSDEPNNKLERSNTFTRHLSSLKRIFNSKQNLKTTSQIDLAKVNNNNGSPIIDQTITISNSSNLNKNSLKSIPVTINSNTSSTNKQLTISVNNNNINNNNNNNLETKNKDNYDTISIPPSNSNTSFTIRSHSNENIGIADNNNSINKTENNLNKNTIEKKKKIFNLKLGKNKKNKTKN